MRGATDKEKAEERNDVKTAVCVCVCMKISPATPGKVWGKEGLQIKRERENG